MDKGGSSEENKGFLHAVFCTPLRRRIQTTVMFLFTLFIISCLVIWLSCIFNPILWIFYIPYIIFAHFLNRTQSCGGREWKIVSNFPLWKYFGSYFPARVMFE